MIWCVRAALALAILVFVPGLRESFEPPKAAVVRVCGLGLLAAAALAWRGRRCALTLTDAAVAAWLVVEVVATAGSESPLVSLVGESMQRDGLLTSLALVGIYCGARLSFTNDRPNAISPAANAPRTIDLTIASATIAGAYALAQSIGLDPLRWEDAPIYTQGGAALRPFGTLGHPNLLGAVTAATGSAALALVVAEPRGRWWRATAGVVLAGATLVSLSRGAWLAAAAGVGVGLTLALRARPGDAARRALLVLGGLAVAMVAVVVAAGWGARLAARAQEMFTGAAGSGASRLEIWRTAERAWLARPMLGHGPDTFELVFPRFQTAAYWRHEWGGLPFHAHSIVLNTLATRGALGLVAAALWAAALAAAAFTAWRRDPLTRPLIAALVGVLVACVAAGLFGALGVAGALLVVVASAAIATLGAPPPAGATAPPPRTGRAPLVAALSVAVVVAACVVAELRASAAARAAEDWLRIARTTEADASAPARAEALEAAALAARWSPLDDSVHRLRSEALLGMAALALRPEAALADATREAQRAVQLVPSRVGNHEQLARVFTARFANGDRAAAAGAHQAIDRMVHLAPTNAMMLLEGARLELMLDHPEPALAAARRAATLYPEVGDVLAVMARALLATGQRDSARMVFERALRAAWIQPAERRQVERELEGLGTPHP